MSQPAYIYARFSSLEQGKGTSLRRQFDNAREFIKRNDFEYPRDEHGDLVPTPERDLADEGRSAYSGANRAPGGALFEFERQALAGHFRNGAYLVVEHLDRLSRQGYEEVLQILKNLSSNGVTVVTIDGPTYWNAYERADMGKVMMAIVKAEAAHDHSHEKSKKLKKAWNLRIEAIQAGEKRAFTPLLPAWMEVDPESKAPVLNRHRSAVLREIYEWYDAGYGLPAMVRMLNGRKEPSWGYGARMSKAGWNTAYLHKLLTNRAVLGEYRPGSRGHSEIGKRDKGILIHDYYPQAIPADLFNRVQSRRASRRNMGGKAEKTMSNLFSGMMFCRECGAAMYFQSQQRAGRLTNHKSRIDGRKLTYTAKIDRSYMMCNNNRRLHVCTNNARFRYEFLEESILDAVLNVAMDNKSFEVADRAATVRTSIAETERLLEGKRYQLENLGEALKDRFSKTVNNQIADLEEEIERDEAELKTMRADLLKEEGDATPDEHLARVAQVRDSLHSEDTEERYGARVRVRAALARVLTIQCDQQGIATVILANGLMAWRFDKQGKPRGSVDMRDKLDTHKGLTRGELASNASNVEAVLRRSAA